MDPKKRQELKDKATKGMKFTHEGTSYGMYKGSGKPTGAMAAFAKKDKEKKKEMKKEGLTMMILGKEVELDEKCWKGYEKKGMKTMFGKRYPNCVKKEEVELPDVKKQAKVVKGKRTGVLPLSDPKTQVGVSGGYKKEEVEQVVEHHQKDKDGNTIPHDDEKIVNESDKKGKGSGTKDACYHKVKSRYSVWPSAYASGALVKCRKKGAANWGNSKKEDFSDWKSDFLWEDGDTAKKITEDDMKGMSVSSGHKRPTKSGAGMTAKGVAAYRRRNPGSKLKTAVTTEPSKLKKGSKSANRRKSYCARSAGQMKKFPKAAKDPNSRLRQARRRWNC